MTGKSDVFMDRSVLLKDPNGERAERVQVPDCKCWVDGAFWVFRSRDDKSEMIFPVERVLDIRSGGVK